MLMYKMISDIKKSLESYPPSHNTPDFFIRRVLLPSLIRRMK